MCRCFSSHPESQALKHIIQNCVASFKCNILPQNKNKDLLPGNLTGFHGAEFGTYACLLAVTISWLPNLYWNLRKAVPSAPEVPDAMEIWLVKISMKASVIGWWVLASLTWTFSVTSVMTNNHSDYCLKVSVGGSSLNMLTHQRLKRHQLWHFGATYNFLYWPEVLHLRQSLFRDTADSATSQTRSWIIAQKLTSTVKASIFHLWPTCSWAAHLQGRWHSPLRGKVLITQNCCTMAILNVCYQTSCVSHGQQGMETL